MGKQRSLRQTTQDTYSPTNMKSSPSPPPSHSINHSNSTSPIIPPNQLGAIPGRFERILPKYHHIPMVPQYAVSMVPAHPVFSYPYPLPTTMSGGYPRVSDERQEKEILRKVSHSAIERRRRERINDKIFQLKTLVPSCANQVNLHKLSILESAIEYIHELQSRLSQMDDSPKILKAESPIFSSQDDTKDSATASPIFEGANNLLMLTSNTTVSDTDKYCYPENSKVHSARSSGMSVYDLLC